LKNLFKFNKKYFLSSLLLFGIEILIATFAHDRIVRPYIGDLLVVILIYCLVKSFFNPPVLKTALAVLLFSYTVEILQYFDIITKLGLQYYGWARIIIGTSFEWVDLLAYTAGIVLVIYGERTIKKQTAAKRRQ
jgi:Protein of unknown function (DUF2809)